MSKKTSNKRATGTAGASAEQSATKPRTARQQAIKTACAPVYGLADGVLSFRQALCVRERNIVERALAIVGRCLTADRTVCDSPDAVKTYLQLQMAGESAERFGVLFLDAQNRLIALEFMFTGTLTQTSVYPREVVHATLKHGAAAVVLAHNHPSGIVTPSQADKWLTQSLKSTLALIDVRVLDHVIVGPHGTLSMAERGLL